MPDSKRILSSIAVVARRLGRAPSLSEFVSLAGVPRYFVSRFYPKWNDAVRAAGLRPYRLKVRPEDGELLKDWGETVRRKRALPSRRAYLVEGKYDPRTLEKRFGDWSSLPQAFCNFAKGKPEWADVIAISAAPVPEKKRGRANDCSTSGIRLNKAEHAPLKDRATYGKPMDFRGLRHEPVNEQGVVLLFGILAKELGYLIEAVQNGFPDCEAKRQIAAERWQRVQIEFEFESKNFRDHGHPSDGCDVIVCWRHNWGECPKHIEVVELSRVVKSLG
ncbi:MAG TPA: hypothetical protein VED66_01460 [Candidatus Sulfotelmatobacter sp.]|nr:hypothetical protein [Candidatus Sulfotelmatobacter sp.]